MLNLLAIDRNNEKKLELPAHFTSIFNLHCNNEKKLKQKDSRPWCDAGA